MDSERFQGRYIPAGVMRSATGHSALIDRGPGKRIQCCPPGQVEDEVYKICELAQRYIVDEVMNPFALAAWFHLTLVRCLPFDGGNGRTTRLIASIPLIRHGYPPISVPLNDRNTYFETINQAYNGDFVPLTQSMIKGMQAGMRKAKSLHPQGSR
ncbi:hypothetical protein PENSPDRAFT_586573 [Peniophora sp. CONT]|nr:hypothetical protein PENSPDRAFT_586573 [Peniophora sp. CONT]